MRLPLALVLCSVLLLPVGALFADGCQGDISGAPDDGGPAGDAAPADAPADAPGAGPVDAAGDAPGRHDGPPTPPGPIGPQGGTLDRLRFAIVGDTRPAVIDDTAAYPSAIIGRIWQDVQAESPRPAFALATGDYVFASTTGAEAAPQMDRYLAARAAFSGTLFPALGNHECTGATASNCATTTPPNYAAFMSKMLGPLGLTQPYYAFRIDAADATWSAKFVVIAANAWSSAQATWLDGELAKPTTYTLVVRHEPAAATTAPGVTPSVDIIRKHPLTLLIVGHTHTLEHLASAQELVVGNGGAPLSSGVNYGYVIADQRPDGALTFTAYDYESHAVMQSFAVKADGSAAP
ncbi:MAG TPA: metallophosphoesterase [Polyangia bacterium]